MSRRTVAIVVAAPLMVALWAAALLVPVPFVTFAPGVTVDVLSEVQGQERVQVEGHETYYDGGELRMTTVSVTSAEAEIGLFTALSSWLSDERAVVPRDAYYEDGVTEEESQLESSVQMISSQDSAVAAALTELGHELEPSVEILHVNEGTPADGKLGVRDRIISVNGKRVGGDIALVAKEVRGSDGKPVDFVVLRDGKELEVTVTPQDVDGVPTVGVLNGPSFAFPFRVQVNIDPRIGGPSAGLVFALAIYDTLTEGSLTEGHKIAGTGTISPEGEVGSIGGIEQKIPAARKTGAELFLVPEGNCAEALGAANGDMKLVRATTLTETRKAIEAWVADPKTDLPSCEDVE